MTFPLARRRPRWPPPFAPPPPAAPPAAGPVWPAGAADLRTDLQLGSAWIPLGRYVYQRNMPTITRGRSGETATAQPQTCPVELNNRDGRFTRGNPAGIYYGQLGRNTPIRLSLPNAGNVPLPLNGEWDFEDGIGAWNNFFSGATLAQSAVWAKHGQFSLQVTPDGVHAPIAFSELFSLAAGEVVTVGAWVNVPSGWATGAQVQLWWTGGAGGTYSSVITVIPAATDTLVSISTTVPPGVTAANMAVKLLGTPASTVIWYADVAAVVYGPTPFVPSAPNYLRFADDNLSAATCPDKASLHVTGDLDVQADMRLDHHGPSSVAAKWDSTGLGRAWALYLTGNGNLGLSWSTDGTANTVTAALSTVTVPLGRIAVRATLQASTGNVTFYTAPSVWGPWTALGAVVAGTAATSVFASTAPITVGYSAGWTADNATYAGCLGRVFAFALLNGIGGTTVASPDFTAPPAGVTSFSDGQGNIWALTGTAEISARAYRFHGELAALPQQWDPSGTDVSVQVAAAGIFRRLAQNNAPLFSAMKRAILSRTGSLAPAAYWPCEDSAASKQIGSGLAGGFPMLFASGAPNLAADTSFACSSPLPQINNSVISGVTPSYTLTGNLVIRMLVNPPASGITATPGAVIAKFEITGDLGYVLVLYTLQTQQISIIIANYPGFPATTIAQNLTAGQPAIVSIEIAQSGGNYTPTLAVLPVGGSIATTSVAAAAGIIGRVSRVYMGAVDNLTLFQQPGNSVFGHVFIQTALEPLSNFSNPLAAWAGETAGNRFARLCGENNVPVRVYGYPGVSAAMGTQAVDTFVNLLQSCESADRGVMHESRNARAVAYRTLASMTNQPPALVADYAQFHLGDGPSGGLVPEDDDLRVYNDVTVTRTLGSSANAQLADGSPLSVSPPPAAAGDYATASTQNLSSDTQLPDAASWLVHMGTVNEQRYPVIPFQLTRTALTLLYPTVAALDVGDRLDIVNPPSWLPPGPIKQVMLGMSETIGGIPWPVRANCAPESPYETGLYDDLAYGRADTDGTQLAAPVGTGDTSMFVTTTGPSGITWTTDPTETPFSIIMGGEVMTVTAVYGPPGAFLSGQDTGFEGGKGNWVAGANTAIAASSAQAHSGTGALALTSAAAGDMHAYSCPQASILSLGLPCNPGDTISCAAWFRAATAERSCQVGGDFSNAAGTTLGSVFVPVTLPTDITSGWILVSGTVTAPANAAFARLAVAPQATGAANEVHYVDDCFIGDLTTGPATRQQFTVTRSVNGVSKTHQAGEDIRPSPDPIYAMT